MHLLHDGIPVLVPGGGLVMVRQAATCRMRTGKARLGGYDEADLLDGVVITGASVMHERIKAGAATLSF